MLGDAEDPETAQLHTLPGGVPGGVEKEEETSHAIIKKVERCARNEERHR